MKENRLNEAAAPTADMTVTAAAEMTPKTVAQTVLEIQQKVAQKARSLSIDPDSICIMAVTKTVAPELVNAAIGQGIRLLGENRVQEYLSKADRYQLEDGCQVHFIGTLQTNKVKYIVDKVDMIESVNSLRLAQEIDRQCKKISRRMDILVEVNIGREESKSGILPEELDGVLDQLARLSNIRVRGLMAIPPAGPEEETRQYFAKMQQLFVDRKAKKLDNSSMDFLSMGMSHDYLTAIEYGANILRLGTAMFGKRIYPTTGSPSGQ